MRGRTGEECPSCGGVHGGTRIESSPAPSVELDVEHHFKCPRGRELQASIAVACEAGRCVFVARDEQVTGECPSCSEKVRKKLADAYREYRNRRSN